MPREVTRHYDFRLLINITLVKLLSTDFPSKLQFSSQIPQFLQDEALFEPNHSRRKTQRKSRQEVKKTRSAAAPYNSNFFVLSQLRAAAAAASEGRTRRGQRPKEASYHDPSISQIYPGSSFPGAKSSARLTEREGERLARQKTGEGARDARRAECVRDICSSSIPRNIGAWGAVALRSVTSFEPAVRYLGLFIRRHRRRPRRYPALARLGSLFIASMLDARGAGKRRVLMLERN